MNNKILVYALAPYILLILSSAQANAISASFMEGQFEEQMYIPKVDSIEAWEQPRTQYTPKNLRSEYQIRYNGTELNGRNGYSYTTHFTDYDTYITQTYKQEGKYYAKDNLGRTYLLGDEAKDYTQEINSINQAINNNSKSITNNSKAINNVNSKVNGLSNQVGHISDRVDRLDTRLDDMNSRMKQGFATITALTSLHPNPRSNEKLEVSFGTGIYMDTMAGAVGLFYHPNDRVQIYAGGAYGGHDSWAGGAGITFSLGGHKKNANN